jgi:hypothetical protein
MEREPSELLLRAETRALLFAFHRAIGGVTNPTLELRALRDVESTLEAHFADPVLGLMACVGGGTSEHLVDLSQVVPLTETARKGLGAIRPHRVVIGTHPDGHAWTLVAPTDKVTIYQHDRLDGTERRTTLEALVLQQLELHGAPADLRSLPPAPTSFSIRLVDGLQGERIDPMKALRRVTHPKFGPGEVLSEDHSRGEPILEVRFASGELKKLLARFLKDA